MPFQCKFSAFLLLRTHRSRPCDVTCENSKMNFQRIIAPIAVVAGVVLGYRAYGWAGIAAVATMLVFWVLLNFNRMMQVLKRAANRPVGYTESAVMLNAKLKLGMNLLHVVAMTKSLGLLTSVKGEQPEVYVWKDGSESHVTSTFASGKLSHYELYRPQQDDEPSTISLAPLPIATPAQDRGTRAS